MSGDGPRRAHFPARLVPDPAPGATRPGPARPSPARPSSPAHPGATRAVPPRPVVASSGHGMDSAAVRGALVDRLAALGGMEPPALAAMRAVPRHLFLDPGLAPQAYLDNALPIGHGQTISKPSVVARCASVVLAALGRRPQRVLEIGTGCGYQAAVLAGIADEVYSVERIRALHELARSNLRALRLANLRLILGDGSTGAFPGAPFDAIVSAAASAELPADWIGQLAPGGVVVAPVGQPQRLMAYRRLASGRVESWCVEDAHFVPLKSGVL